MNGNLSFNILPNGQQTIQTIGYGLPQVQQALQYVCSSGFQFQNNVQGMDFCLPNQQLIPAAGQTYACINQNGMTYLAITPNIQQQTSPQCYQAVETPQGLQLFQVINNPITPVNFGPVCVQNVQQAQGFLPTFSPYPAGAVGLESSSIPVLNNQDASQPPVQEYQGSINQETDMHVDEVQNEEEKVEEIYEETCEETTTLDECQDFSSDEHESELNQNIETTQDPLSALSSLTSSISSLGDISNGNLLEVYKNVQNSFPSNIPLPPLGTSLGTQQVLGLPDQQFPPNTRAFQILVPTPQGKLF